MSLKQRMPLMRWSFIRMGIGARHFAKTGQWGDGREAADWFNAHRARGCAPAHTSRSACTVTMV
jgi:hypothetical protein